MPFQNPECELHSKAWYDAGLHILQAAYQLHIHIADQDEWQLAGQNGKCALHRQQITICSDRERDTLKPFFCFGWQHLAAADLQARCTENFADTLLGRIPGLSSILTGRVNLLLARFLNLF